MPKKAQSAPVKRDPLALAVVLLALSGTVIGWFATTPFMTVDLAVLCVAVASGAAGVGVLLRGAGRFSRVAGAGLALVGWLTLASVMSPRIPSAVLGQSGSGVGLLVLIGLILVAAFARGSMRSVAEWLRVVAPVMLGVQTTLVLLQAVTGQVTRGTLPNSSYLAELMVLLLPFAFDPDEPRSGARWAVAVASVFALAVSGARVAFVVALLWLAWKAWRARIAGSDAATAATIAGVSIAAFAAGLLLSQGDFSRWTPAALLGERVSIWAMALAAAMMRPIRGWGADGFGVGGSNAASIDALGRELVPVFGPLTNDPHNVFLWMLVSGGFIALGLALWFVVETVLLARSSEVKSEESSRRSSRTDAMWALLMFAIVVLTQPIVPQTLPIFALVLGVAIASVGSAAGGREPESIGGLLRWATFAGVIVVTILGASALTRVVADSIGPDDAVAQAQTLDRLANAVRIDPHLHYQSSIQWAYAIQVDPALASSEPDVAALERAQALDRRYYLYSLEEARTRAFYGAPAEEIIATHEAVLELYETSPEAHARLAREFAVSGNRASAEEHLAVVVVQRPLDVITLEMTAEAYAYLGDEASAAQYRQLAEDARAFAR